MLSIIVPVFNEEEFIEDCINSLERAIKGRNAELIFIDGGSTDKTTQICRELGKQVYDSP
ncbi:MAG TPA: glycosyl transferase, partial [Balneola sp.]|nr:glycosyl transferase [Balneola sp.]